MILGRLLGWLLVAAAIVVVGRDAANAWYQGAWTFVPAGELWYQLHPPSLQGLQPLVQSRLFAFWPEVWDVAVVPVLALPAAALLGGLGLVFLLLFRRRRRRGMLR
ncbi:hypothetical protein [Stella sp.]|uniref:hypothetical protein n=1 Tax=Stella sp. TaxID=2912054 RepID=UPI0035AEA14A